MQLSSISNLVRFWRCKPRTECGIPSAEIADLLWPSVIIAGIDSLSELIPPGLSETQFYQVALKAWEAVHNSRDRSDEHGIREFECYPIVNPASITNDSIWGPFSARMERSAMRSSGLPKQYAMALAHATYELADNVIQHSGLTITNPAHGVVAYYSQAKSFGWLVADNGRGALASLTTNPEWVTLADEAEALGTILSKHASRRPGMEFGNGYRDLFRALVDRNASIELWSGDAIVELSLERNARIEKTYSAEFQQGFIIHVAAKKDV